MTDYYNENDPGAAQVLRNLIEAKLIPYGVVDDRSILDVRPSDLAGFRHCHFFAGIGGWALAMQLAGWPDDRPLWTGSCPCQPFSAAGKGNGFDDERHLWPYWHWLIEQCAPPEIAGEQVASRDGLRWLDLVQDDCEASNYAFGAVDLSVPIVGAPHIRQRLGFYGRMADADEQGSGGRGIQGPRQGDGSGDGAARERSGGLSGVSGGVENTKSERHQGIGEHRHDHAEAMRLVFTRGSESGGLADADSQGLSQRGSNGRIQRETMGSFERQTTIGLGDTISRLADADGGQAGAVQPGGEHGQQPEDGRTGASGPRPGPVNGFWRDADWLFCRDGRWRPVEPGTFPLAHGLPVSMGKMPPGLAGLASLVGLDAVSLRRAKAYRKIALRGYGNAIVPQVFAHFLKQVMAI